jgi:hypothetical protein
VVVVCGGGGNGGDGYVVARALAGAGVEVAVVAVVAGDALTGDARLYRDAYLAAGGAVHEATDGAGRLGAARRSCPRSDRGRRDLRRRPDPPRRGPPGRRDRRDQRRARDGGSRSTCRAASTPTPARPWAARSPPIAP